MRIPRSRPPDPDRDLVGPHRIPRSRAQAAVLRRHVVFVVAPPGRPARQQPAVLDLGPRAPPPQRPRCRPGRATALGRAHGAGRDDGAAAGLHGRGRTRPRGAVRPRHLFAAAHESGAQPGEPESRPARLDGVHGRWAAGQRGAAAGRACHQSLGAQPARVEEEVGVEPEEPEEEHVDGVGGAAWRCRLVGHVSSISTAAYTVWHWHRVPQVRCSYRPPPQVPRLLLPRLPVGWRIPLVLPPGRLHCRAHHCRHVSAHGSLARGQPGARAAHQRPLGLCLQPPGLRSVGQLSCHGCWPRGGREPARWHRGQAQRGAGPRHRGRLDAPRAHLRRGRRHGGRDRLPRGRCAPRLPRQRALAALFARLHLGHRRRHRGRAAGAGTGPQPARRADSGRQPRQQRRQAALRLLQPGPRAQADVRPGLGQLRHHHGLPRGQAAPAAGLPRRRLRARPVPRRRAVGAADVVLCLGPGRRGRPGRSQVGERDAVHLPLALSAVAHDAHPRRPGHLVPDRPARLLRELGRGQEPRGAGRGRALFQHAAERQPRARGARGGEPGRRVLHEPAGLWRLRPEQGEQVDGRQEPHELHLAEPAGPRLHFLCAALLLLPPGASVPPLFRLGPSSRSHSSSPRGRNRCWRP